MLDLIKDLKKEINSVTAVLVQEGLCDEQNFPAEKKDAKTGVTELCVSGDVSFSAAMRNISYEDAYNEIDESNSYNIKMLDGGLIQLLYKLDGNNNLLSHRLSFYSSPSHESYQNEPEVYEIDAIYADFIKKNIVPFPVRFDFNSDGELHRDGVHPKSHLTLGQYEGCRVPVTAPLGPAAFVKFILSCFYNTAFLEKEDLRGMRVLGFSNCITEFERTLSHFNVGLSSESFSKLKS